MSGGLSGVFDQAEVAWSAMDVIENWAQNRAIILADWRGILKIIWREGQPVSGAFVYLGCATCLERIAGVGKVNSPSGWPEGLLVILLANPTCVVVRNRCR